MRSKRRICLVVAALLPWAAVVAAEPDAAANYRLHINGIAFHFDKGNGSNENNWGVGIERMFGQKPNAPSFLQGWSTFFELDAYQDSYSKLGVSAGFGMQRPMFRYLDAGLKVGLVYEDGLQEDAGSPVLPYLLPFIETRFERAPSIRATLVPPFPPFDIGGLVSLQLIVDLP